VRGGALVPVEAGDGFVDVDPEDEPVIHSATALGDAGPPDQLAATDHSPGTSGHSPRAGWPSGVIEISPLIVPDAYRSSPSSSGISSRAWASCGRSPSWVNGISVGDSTGLVGRDVVRADDDRAVCVRADLHVAAVLPLVHVRVVADDRVGDLPSVPSNSGIGPTLIIWCTIGGRDPGAGHRGDPRAPHAAADRGHRGGDIPLVV
jgi:hypothetical protein